MGVIGSEFLPTIMEVIGGSLRDAKIPFPANSGHSLRHTAATMALEGGAPATAVRDMLRHALLKQTTIYVHTFERMKKGGESFITNIEMVQIGPAHTEQDNVLIKVAPFEVFRGIG